MTYARTYFRDKIVLNNAFTTRLRLEGLPPSSGPRRQATSSPARTSVTIPTISASAAAA
ncbi:MAG: hypothetical protein ACKVZ6_24105 [Kineosporiaceae bacterium]